MTVTAESASSLGAVANCMWCPLSSAGDYGSSKDWYASRGTGTPLLSP